MAGLRSLIEQLREALPPGVPGHKEVRPQVPTAKTTIQVNSPDDLFKQLLMSGRINTTFTVLVPEGETNPTPYSDALRRFHTLSQDPMQAMIMSGALSGEIRIGNVEPGADVRRVEWDQFPEGKIIVTVEFPQEIPSKRTR